MTLLYSYSLDISAAAIGAYNSPVLGVTTSRDVRITASAANGEVGFDSVTDVHVQELNINSNKVIIIL